MGLGHPGQLAFAALMFLANPASTTATRADEVVTDPLLQKRILKLRKTLPTAPEAAAMDEAQQLEQLRLQSALDRQSKTFQALSNIMKKKSDSEAAIIGNLK